MHIAASRPHGSQSVLTYVTEPRRTVRDGGDEAMRILYIDDEPSLRSLVSEFLRMVGHECETEPSGEAGLDRALNGEFDVIICDMHLPGISGADLCRRLLAEKPSIEGRLLLATGDLLSRETQEFFSQTGLPHIHKPFKLHELNSVIKGLARTHRAESTSPSTQ